MHGVSARVPPVDRRDPGRLSPGVELAWYVLAGVTYIAAGSVHKVLLTWLVGPAWVVVWLWFGPAVLDLHRLRHIWARSTITNADTSDEGEGGPDRPAGPPP
jgi:hypothetical protein